MTRYYCLCDSTVIAQTNIPAKRCRKNLLGLFQPRVTDIAFSFFLSAEFSSCCLFLTICFLTLSVVGKTNISFSSGACHLSVTVTPPPPPTPLCFHSIIFMKIHNLSFTLTGTFSLQTRIASNRYQSRTDFVQLS